MFESHLGRHLLFACLLFIVSGCGQNINKYATPVPADTWARVSSDTTAAMVFLRRVDGTGTHAAVYKIEGDNYKLIAILIAGEKTKVEIPPGQTDFMVIGENASFIRVKAENGRTYYAEIDTEDGGTNLRNYFITAVRGKNLQGKKFRERLQKFKPVTANDRAHDWHQTRSSSVHGKWRRWFPRWLENSKKLILQPGDGQS